MNRMIMSKTPTFRRIAIKCSNYIKIKEEVFTKDDIWDEISCKVISEDEIRAIDYLINEDIK